MRARRGPFPDDVLRTADCLRALGRRVDVTEDSVRTDGRGDDAGPRFLAGARLDAGGSATALRFLAALCGLFAGPTTIGGSPQLLRRPAGAVVGALRSLGVSVHGACGGADGARPPLVVAGGPPRGPDVTIDASASSHAVSALLIAASLLRDGLVLRASGAVASRAYVDLTVAVLRDFGVTIEVQDRAWRVPPGGDGPSRDAAYAVEGDWSSAAFLLGAAAATGGDVAVDGLDAASLQPDRRILDVLREFGCAAAARDGRVCVTGRASRPVDVDLGGAPDLAPLVGALGCVVAGTTRVRGAAHLRTKESDRISTVVAAARALGCAAEEADDGFSVTGPAVRGGAIVTAGDHRIAMAFAAAGLAVPGTRIAEPACVSKSCPTFWQDLGALVGPA